MELIHTSAPRGLRPNSRGFCTVAMTRGLPANLVERLEMLSGYRFWFEPGGPQAQLNRPASAHLLVKMGGREWNVASRIAPAAADYSGRTNKIAHHLVLDQADLPDGGPGWLLGQHDLFRSEWTSEPMLIERPPALPRGDRPARKCEAWQRASGDAGWAGELLALWLERPRATAFVIVPIDIDPLELVSEAIALLPLSERWRATFNTVFGAGDVAADVQCQARFVPAIPDAIRLARSTPGAAVIDLPRAGTTRQNRFASAAREGIQLEPVQPGPTLPQRRMIGLPVRVLEDPEVRTGTPPRESLVLRATGVLPLAADEPIWRPDERLANRAAQPTPSRWPMVRFAALFALGGVLLGFAASVLLRSSPSGTQSSADMTRLDHSASEQLVAQLSADKEALAAEKARLMQDLANTRRELDAARTAPTTGPTTRTDAPAPPVARPATEPHDDRGPPREPLALVQDDVQSVSLRQGEGDANWAQRPSETIFLDPDKPGQAVALPVTWKPTAQVDVFPHKDVYSLKSVPDGSGRLLYKSVREPEPRPRADLRITRVDSRSWQVTLAPADSGGSDFRELDGLEILLQNSHKERVVLVVQATIVSDIILRSGSQPGEWSGVVDKGAGKKLQGADEREWAKEGDDKSQRRVARKLSLVGDVANDIRGDLIIAVEEGGVEPRATLTASLRPKDYSISSLPSSSLSAALRELKALVTAMGDAQPRDKGSMDVAGWKARVDELRKQIETATSQRELEVVLQKRLEDSTLTIKDSTGRVLFRVRFPMPMTKP